MTIKHYIGATCSQVELQTASGKNRKTLAGNTKYALTDGAIKEDDPDSKSRKYTSYLPFWA